MSSLALVSACFCSVQIEFKTVVCPRLLFALRAGSQVSECRQVLGVAIRFPFRQPLGGSAQWPDAAASSGRADYPAGG